MVTKSKRKTNRTKPRKVNYLRNAEYYDMQPTLDRLYAESKKGAVFDHLTEMIFSRENILLAYRNIKRNDGSVTPGTDGLKIKDVEKYSPEALVRRIRNITANYTPRAVRRKEIPKPNDPGKTRPLGIPCIWDRLIQQCILQILEPICEARFSENSYGFRPNRSCEQAVAAAYRLMQRSHMHFVVDFDIKGFFDNVDHSKLLRQMWAMGIRDKRLLYLIKRILKAPILLENGTMITPDKGTPQGGIISPLLANIVLNELDWWVESQWQENPLTHLGKPQYNAQGVLDKSHGYRAMRQTRLKEMYMVRYADDFRIFCPSMAEAVRTKEAVTMWLKERLRLDVSPEKTKVVNLHKGYSNFLGIKMRLRTKQDKLVVHSRVADKAVKRIKEQACQKMHDIAKPPAGITETQAIVRYNSFVMGEHNYYCTLMHTNWQLTESHYLANTGNEPLAFDLQDNISDQLGECLDKIGEVLHICKDLLPPNEDEDADDEMYDEDKEESDEEDDLTDLHPDMSPETCAEFSRMLDLTDNAINREHMSRLAFNTGKPERASLMHEQAEKLWHEAFLTMCNYVTMSHKDTIVGIMQKM